MRSAQKLSLGLSSLLSLVGAACGSDPVKPVAPTAAVGGTLPTAATGGSTTPAPGGAGTPAVGGGGVAGIKPAGGAGSIAPVGGAGQPAVTGGTGGTAPQGGGGAVSGGTGAGFKVCGKPAKEGACKATAPGIYAQRLDLDVWYMDVNNDPPVFDPGRGTLSLWFRTTISDICEDGSDGVALTHPCGTTLPPLFADANGGVIQIVFPPTLWDLPMVPSYPGGGSTSGFAAGDILTVAKTAGTLGIELADVTGAFPPYTDTIKFPCKDGKVGAACFPDVDEDGKPGVTVSFQSTGTVPNPGYDTLLGWHFIPAPLSVGGGALGVGASEAYIGTRVRAGGSGAIGPDCKSGMGAADAEDIESRVIGCKTNEGMPCKESGADSVEFLDQNTPVFHVLKVGEAPPSTWKHRRSEVKLNTAASMGPQAKVVRLGDLGAKIACDAVRMALP